MQHIISGVRIESDVTTHKLCAQGNIPKELIKPVDAGSRAAAAYSVPTGNRFIIQATAGIYPGEFGGLLQDGSSLSTNPIGEIRCSLICEALYALPAEKRRTRDSHQVQVRAGFVNKP